jgi:WD40 repeat protein
VVASTSLLDRAQNRPDVEGNLRQLRKQQLVEQGSAVYIPPQAKAGLQASDESRFQLMDEVKEFLASKHKVFLLLGDPGSGKSIFSRALQRDLWTDYKKDGDIPLLVNLPAIDKPEHDMIAKQLRRSEFTEPQIRELKMHRKFILICDGYDESQQTQNLYMSNRLNEPGEWTAKMIISCRTEYIGLDYRDRFQPGDRNNQSKSTKFQEAVMTPFSETQIEDYINEYVSIHQPLWEAKDYKQALDLIPSLKELVKNPFLMALSLEVMPRMMDPGEHLSATHITKVGLYDHFIEHWLERGKKRLGEKKLSPQSRAAFESLIDEGFTRNGIDFLKKLAVAIYKEQDGQPIVEYSRYKDEHSWKAEFFNRDDEEQLLREACPLTRNGNQYRFIHRSLLEYGMALAVFDPQDWRRRATLMPSLDRRGSTSSVSSFETHDAVEREIRSMDLGPDPDSPLVWRNFVNEYSLVQFLEERAQQETVFKQQLLDYIECSKKDKKWRTAAANAITILVRAGVEFRSADLKGIRIPGADLSYGVFDSASLQGADLRKANLRNVWLCGSDLSGTQMKDVQFGELPFLKHECGVMTCLYSPDGSSFAMALYDCTITVYATSNWEKLSILSGHDQYVSSIAYSPNGDQIVSGSPDSTVRVWNAPTGDCLYIFIGHNSYIYSVAFSPQGNLIASRGSEGMLRIWDVDTGGCLSVISSCGYINDQAFSPKGENIAFGTQECTVRLWDVATRECCNILIGHTSWISSVAYSTQGDVLISTGGDGVVRVWDVEAGTYRHSFQTDGNLVISPKGIQIATFKAWDEKEMELWDLETGARIRTLDHKNVYSAVYSSQGDQIISGGEDMTVRLWDIDTGECRHMMTGHAKPVRKVLYPPKGDHITSLSDDWTVRLWNVGSGASRKISSHHSGSVLSIKHLPKRNQIATCSQDSTIRLWDAELGVCCRTLIGHSKWVYNIAYSPQEDQLVSCSKDTTVRLWDVESGACRNTLTGHTGEVNDIAFSPQGNQIASACDDNTIRIWNVKTGECQHVLEGHSSEVWMIMYSPQGNQLASTGMDGTVRLWDTETGICQHAFTDHTNYIERMDYSPNGNHIVSGSWDMTVRLWDVKAGVSSHILIGHQNQVTRVAYSPRGDKVASASRDEKTVRLWDVVSGECRHTLIGHKKQISEVTYSPRGNLIASWGCEGEARLWNVETGDCCWTLEYDTAITTGYSYVQHSVAWMDSDIDAFMTGDCDRSVRVWDVTEEDGQYSVRMRWRSTNGFLDVEEACVQDVLGLSDHNKRLLKQRGAVGEPNLRLREAGKKAMAMTSVVSTLKTSSGTKASDTSSIASTISSRSTQNSKPSKRRIQRHLRTSRYIL